MILINAIQHLTELHTFCTAMFVLKTTEMFNILLCSIQTHAKYYYCECKPLA